ncbi:hypothetical protein COB11_06745 [Candidatus Aerophobetes bacterium]|uniref:Porin n=1 Tax=Aerophobetes bacterium TaxID=2030807 RepID=A0A2A4YEH1_UNCAE|nr:MAG: hypothetical protein COB11_06745 [Candidatus Aerophobetes bacterium]
MKKQFLYGSIVATVACSVSAFANPSADQRIEKLEREMKQVRVENVAGTAGAQYGTGQYQIHGGGWFIEGEALLWHARSAGTDWVLVLNQAAFPQQGHIKSLDFSWDWGFRVAVGKFFSHDAWDAQIIYTRFHTGDHAKINRDFTTASGTGGQEGATGPSGTSLGTFQYKLTYDCVDLELGKSVFPSSRLNLRPHAGIKSLWMNGKGRLSSENFIDALDTFLPVAGNVNVKVLDQSKFWGIGPKAGIDLNWFFSKQLRLRSAVEGSLQWSYFQVIEEELINVEPVGSPQASTTTRITANMHRFVPTARMLMGLSWGDYINNHKNFLEVGIDYEVNYFWRANQQLNQEDTVPANLTLSSTQSVRLLFDRISDDVAFQGVTFRVRFDF